MNLPQKYEIMDFDLTEPRYNKWSRREYQIILIK
jgi:hypothetical protein